MNSGKEQHLLVINQAGYTLTPGLFRPTEPSPDYLWTCISESRIEARGCWVSVIYSLDCPHVYTWLSPTLLNGFLIFRDGRPLLQCNLHVRRLVTVGLNPRRRLSPRILFVGDYLMFVFHCRVFFFQVSRHSDSPEPTACQSWQGCSRLFQHQCILEPGWGHKLNAFARSMW